MLIVPFSTVSHQVAYALTRLDATGLMADIGTESGRIRLVERTALKEEDQEDQKNDTEKANEEKEETLKRRPNVAEGDNETVAWQVC